METETERFLARWNLAAYKARCFIQGTIKNEKTHSIEPHSGHWSPIFLDHELVQLADAEGWSKELRSAVFPPVRFMIMNGKTVDKIGALMPSESWVRATREQAAVTRAGQEWQAAQPERPTPRHGKLRPISTAKPDFRKMQAESRNQYLHVAPRGLTGRSRAMMGDD